MDGTSPAASGSKGSDSHRVSTGPDLSNVIFLDDYRVVTLIALDAHDEPSQRISAPRPPGSSLRHWPKAR